MKVSHRELEAFSKFVLEHEAFPVILERMSIRYWGEFRGGNDQVKAKAAAKQENMDAFFSELQAILNEITEDKMT